MKKTLRILIPMLLLPIMLAGCIIVPWDDGYYGGHHHRRYGGGYYDRR